jgi:hypothetical protein
MDTFGHAVRARVCIEREHALQAEYWISSLRNETLALASRRGFVHGVNDRLAALFALLTQAGPEVAEVLTASEDERLTGVSAFVADLAHEGILRPGADHVQTADSCWAPTGPRLFTELIIGRGWDADTYQQWLADMLAATLLNAR